MKIFKTLLSTVLLVCSISLSAATEPVEDPSLKIKASEEIAKLLDAPSFEVPENVSAYISLMVNDDGEIVVLCVKTDDEKVEQFVKSRLNYHKLYTPLLKGHEYKVPLTIVSKS